MSSETKFTPGPWEARCFLVVGGERKSDRICHVGTSTSLPPSRSRESEANAHLISAAPDMYEACQKALNYIQNTESELGITLSSGDALRAALAKARGEQ